MMKTLTLALFLSIAVAASAQNKGTDIPSKQAQITTALYAAPDNKNEGAKVYGYNEAGELVVLREGTNDLICLGDDPSKPGVSVACYYRDLEQYMARGRELEAEGKSAKEKRETRKREMESGELVIPDKSMLFVFSAKDADRDAATGELKNGKIRYVIYTPYATLEETGLPDKPYIPGMPWLMDPGTHRAHIMITPAD